MSQKGTKDMCGARGGFGMIRALGLILLGWLALAAGPARPAQEQVFVMQLDGAIGPASAAFITDGLDEAREANAALVVIQMDTPGGLDTSMREIIRKILAMPVPVVSYVNPSGARAASAGTFIMYASHVAAMTPGTNLGAATPVQIGAPAPDQGDKGEKAEKQPAGASASERKAINDAVAYIRSLAELRGRNADWAEQAVREGASLSAEAALQRGVIEVVAPDLPSLLAKLDGMTVTVKNQERTLSTSGIAVKEIEPDWRTKLLATITDPNIALILMMIGTYGLLFEFLNPGSLVPGTIGAICLLIGLYALAVLPVNFAGVGLIVLGIGLMVAEGFAPSFGILGLGGLVAFVIGAAIMIESDVPEFQVSWSTIAALGVFSTGLLIVVARTGLRSFRHRVVTGADGLVGSTATVEDWAGSKGHVFVHSERWNAHGPEGLRAGDQVRVEALSGLNLTVSPPTETQD
jgi:membrane-bound serine protease (ClpP class)